MAPNGEAELSKLLVEVQALRASLGQQTAARPWPQLGDVVVIRDAWDGPTLYGNDNFLSLFPGDRVTVFNRNHEGLLYGAVDVEFGQQDRTGWFGGKGCCASLDVTLPVPLGPSRALRALPEGPPSVDPGQGDLTVEAYITRHGIDDKAGQALRELEPELQHQVIESDLTNCRNPSAVLLTRIDRVKAGAPASGGLPPAAARGAAGVYAAPLEAYAARSRSRTPPRSAARGATNSRVEDFILRNDLDEKAAEALRELEPEQQAPIIEIELSNVRNPSAVVQSRIALVAASTASLSATEKFILETGIDDKAAGELRVLSPAEQKLVIDSYPTNARNPSAVVSSRIQAVKTVDSQRQAVESYIMRNGVDESVGAMLRAMSAEGQRQILASDLTGCRNPSAVLQSRIRAVEAQLLGPVGAAPLPLLGPPLAAPAPLPLPSRQLPAAPSQMSFTAATPWQPPPPAGAPPTAVMRSANASFSGVEAFIVRNAIDQEAAQALRQLRPDTQRQVMERGELVNCRNASKVLLSRIRETRTR